MLSKKINDALNKQIAMEAYAANYYLAMASWCEIKGFDGSAQFFYAQAEEERAHMMKIFRFVNEADGHAYAPAIAQPDLEFTSFQSLFEIALTHEKKVTKSIDEILKLATEASDFRTQNLLQWFVDEQLEEENQMQVIIDKLKLIGDNGTGLYMMDSELAAKAKAKAQEEGA
ncbi:MAG: ferritin [Calditrichae bacterium]|nr:ferritin [Calditrichota bacterium]MCB0294900.1 ferritin [Calditrichota bacterium]MCB9089394.1 ferritin [Calditrichia bacterium]